VIRRPRGFRVSRLARPSYYSCWLLVAAHPANHSSFSSRSRCRHGPGRCSRLVTPSQLTFTLPTKTVAGERLAEAPAIEILRGTVKPDGSPDTKSFARWKRFLARFSANTGAPKKCKSSIALLR